eukprot:scaffold12525_cov91-Phaeocystis_antarctica.AAC.2
MKSRDLFRDEAMRVTSHQLEGPVWQGYVRSQGAGLRSALALRWGGLVREHSGPARRQASASGRRGSGQGGARCSASKESHGGRGARAGRASEGGKRRGNAPPRTPCLPSVLPVLIQSHTSPLPAVASALPAAARTHAAVSPGSGSCTDASVTSASLNRCPLAPLPTRSTMSSLSYTSFASHTLSSSSMASIALAMPLACGRSASHLTSSSSPTSISSPTSASSSISHTAAALLGLCCLAVRPHRAAPPPCSGPASSFLYSSVSELNPFNPCRGHSALLISALQSPITGVHPG